MVILLWGVANLYTYVRTTDVHVHSGAVNYSVTTFLTRLCYGICIHQGPCNYANVVI